MLEEAYEVVEAMDRDDRAALCEELGDLLLEAVFVAQICAEDGDFNIADAAEAVTAKLVRRHPHVFGDGAAGDGTASAAGPRRGRRRRRRCRRPRWRGPRPCALPRRGQAAVGAHQARGARRRAPAARTTLLDGIPEALPSLLRASRIGARAANVGFDWEEAEQVVDKADEEIAELRDANRGRRPGADREGDRRPALHRRERRPQAARRSRVGPPDRQRPSSPRRFRAVEQRLESRGRTLHDASPDELEREWATVKTQTANHPGVESRN